MKWCVFICLMLFSSTAFAQQEAYEEFARANKLAAAGAVTRAIPHYKRVIELAPEQYPLAYFNLAEVWRYKKSWAKAGLLYQVYLSLGDDPVTKKEAKQALIECKRGREWPKLSITSTPSEDTKIKVSGYIVSKTGTVDLELPAGDYDVEAIAVDHEPATQKITVAKEPTSVNLTLTKVTYFGRILVKVDEHPGAKIRIHAGSGKDSKVLHEFSAPMRQPVKLTEGRHFVSVALPDYQEWIRNVAVGRDNDTVVAVKLTRAMPEEIR